MSLEQALREREDALQNCVHCGFCLPVCPTYTRLGDEADSPRGRLYLMKAVVEGRLAADSEAFSLHIDRCLGCRACEPVCPSGVEYGLLLERARSVIRDASTRGGLERRLPDLVANPPLGALGGALIRILRWTRIPVAIVHLLPSWRVFRPFRLGCAMLAASSGGDLRGASPEPDGRTSQPDVTSTTPLSSTPADQLHDSSQSPSPASQGSADPHGERSVRPVRVGVLTGCVQTMLFDRVNQATVRTLEANGFEVVPVPAQGCCGALHAHSGDLRGAHVLAERNVRAFGTADIDFLAINAAGCGAALREYGELLSADPKLSAMGSELSTKVRDVTELLADRGPRVGAPLSVRVAYDAPCHLLHAQGVESPPLQVLEAVPGLDVRIVERADECCGGAGIYAITHAELGGQIGRDKVRSVLEVEPQGFVTGNPGCLMQIGAEARLAGHPLPGWHPVELLDESYRRAGIYADRGDR